jgi:hypothetical protein
VSSLVHLLELCSHLVVQRNVVTAKATTLKLVSCANCQQPFGYLLDVEATGEDVDLLGLDHQRSLKRARAQAKQRIVQKGHTGFRPVPCPHCGFYQDEMAQQLREKGWVNPIQVVGAIITLASLVFLCLDLEFAWVLTLLVASAGLAVVAYGYVISFRFDPHAGDADDRKELGRQQTLWGERLEEYLNPTSESGGAGNRKGLSETEPRPYPDRSPDRTTSSGDAAGNAVEAPFGHGP